jgi:O-antigen/teichoic acid export membrane protein
MAFTLASVLYTIAYASMQSAFAEGSHNEATMGAHVKKAAKFLAVLLLPAALLMALMSSFLLTVFGPDYAREASALLQLFALGALPVAVSSAMGAIFKVTKNLRGVVSMNTTFAVITLSLSYFLVPTQGLLAIGWAWIIGNLAACGIGALFLLRIPKHSALIRR